MIRDQRHLLGAREHQTVGEVIGYWAFHRNATGFIRDQLQLPRRDLEFIETGASRVAYVNHGRWLVECGAEFDDFTCNDHAAAWPENPRACCLGCGSIYTVVFPTAQEIAEATAVLMRRPNANRNFRPDKGEDVADLKVDNLTRGVPLAVGGGAVAG